MIVFHVHPYLFIGYMILKHHLCEHTLYFSIAIITNRIILKIPHQHLKTPRIQASNTAFFHLITYR